MSIKLKRFQANRVRSILLNRKDIIIPKIYRNYLGTLGTTRTFYNNFTNRKGYRGLVKVNKKIGEDRKIQDKDLRIFIYF